MNSRNLLLTVLEIESLRSECQHGQLRAVFWLADFSLYLHRVEGARDQYGASFFSAFNKFTFLIKFLFLLIASDLVGFF